MATKTIAGALGAVIVVALLVGVFLHRLHQAQPPVPWRVAPAQDTATQQAEQQIQAQLGQWNSGFGSGDSQKIEACLSPDFIMYEDAHGTVDYTYSQFKTTLESQDFSRTHGNAWRMLSVRAATSCIVNGNTATVGVHLGPGNGFVTLVNTGGRWLITGLRPAH